MKGLLYLLVDYRVVTRKKIINVIESMFVERKKELFNIVR